MRLRAEQGCKKESLVSETFFFCSHDHTPMRKRRDADCDVDTAAANARDRFVFVGLTEEFVRSVSALEVLLPDWFAGASEELSKMRELKVSSSYNPLTGTNLTGCVSDEAKRLLKARDCAETRPRRSSSSTTGSRRDSGSVAML